MTSLVGIGYPVVMEEPFGAKIISWSIQYPHIPYIFPTYSLSHMDGRLELLRVSQPSNSGGLAIPRLQVGTLQR